MSQAAREFWSTPETPRWRQPVPVTGSADAIVAQALSNVPGYEDWVQAPLPDPVANALPTLTDQELMTVAAAALLRLARHHCPSRAAG